MLAERAVTTVARAAALVLSSDVENEKEGASRILLMLQRVLGRRLLLSSLGLCLPANLFELVLSRLNMTDSSQWELKSSLLSIALSSINTKQFPPISLVPSLFEVCRSSLSDGGVLRTITAKLSALLLGLGAHDSNTNLSFWSWLEGRLADGTSYERVGAFELLAAALKANQIPRPFSSPVSIYFHSNSKIPIPPIYLLHFS